MCPGAQGGSENGEGLGPREARARSREGSRDLTCRLLADRTAQVAAGEWRRNLAYAHGTFTRFLRGEHSGRRALSQREHQPLPTRLSSHDRAHLGRRLPGEIRRLLLALEMPMNRPFI